MFRGDAAQIEERFLSLALCSRESAPPASLRARRFGVERDSLITLESERRFRPEAQCLLPISDYSKKSSPQWRPPGSPPPPPIRHKRTLTSLLPTTFSASPRPA